MKKFVLILILGLFTLPTFAQEYKIGEKVEVEIDEVWFDAFIIDIDGKKVKLNYNGSSDETDFWVKKDKIRKKGPQGQTIKVTMNTGAANPNQKPANKLEDTDKKKQTTEATATVIVTLHNTCSRREELQIGDTVHELEPNKKKEVEVPVGSLVYSIDGGEKKMKGKVTERIKLFHPNCE